MLEMMVIFAHWCPICNMMLPLFEELEKDYVGKVELIWIDVDKNPDVYKTYEIEIVPTLILLREKTELVRMSGMIGERTLRKRIENEINF